MNDGQRQLHDRMQLARDEVVAGAPIVSAIRARRFPALSPGLSFVLWVAFVLVVTPLLLLAFTEWHSLMILVVSTVFGQVAGSLIAHGSSRALGFCSDGSVVVARVPRLPVFERVRGIEKIYDSATVISAEYETPRWRTQEVSIGSDRWYPSFSQTRFEQRPTATHTSQP